MEQFVHLRRAVAPFALACAGLGACTPGAAATPDRADEPAVYVGAVAGSDAVIALVAEGGGVAAYVCGGASSYASLTRWFAGDAPLDRAHPRVDLHARGFALHAELRDDGVAGTLTSDDGAEFAWRAAPRVPGTMTGLYAARDEGCRTGVVVLQPSPWTAPTVQGTWCSAAGLTWQVTPVLPIALTELGFAVRVDLPAGARELMAMPVEPALR